MRKEFAGSANRTELAADINAADNTITLISAAGWPTGSTAPFVLRITRKTDWYQEKMLCSAREGGIVTVQQRGYDSTTPGGFTAGDIVEHVLDATTIDEANAHANQPHGAVLYTDTDDFEVSRKVFVLGAGASDPAVLEQGDIVIDQRGSSGSEDTGWLDISVSPGYQNGWTDLNNSNWKGRYRKLGNIVEVRGLVQGGGINTTIFTLPEGFRPSATDVMASATTVNSTVRVDFRRITGDVLLVSAGGDGATFTTGSWVSIHTIFIV